MLRPPISFLRRGDCDQDKILGLLKVRDRPGARSVLQLASGAAVKGSTFGFDEDELEGAASLSAFVERV
jgi:hypothetical protein